MIKHSKASVPADTPEPVADATGGESVETDVSAKSPDIASAELSQLADQQDRYLRLAAEYDNFRKRSVRERQEAELKGMGLLIRGILDTIDDLGRVAHVDPLTTDATRLQEGVVLVEKKLLKSLAGHGLEIVNPVGHPFDPAVHEALSTVPAESAEEDHLIAQVYQVGYVFNGQLLRAARVVVKQWKGPRERADAD